MVRTPKEDFKLVEKEVKKIIDPNQHVFKRFPLLFSLLGAFGLVATFYGFEHLIDQIPFLSDNPIVLLALGVFTLITTGTLYKKL